MQKLIRRIRENLFLFEQLVKRDFRFKYKGTVLGAFWSVLSPLLTLFIMKIIFTEFFGRNTPHYTIYLFAGNIVMSYFREGTIGGMTSLSDNAQIITKINMPKYLFLLSKNVSALINFLMTFAVFLLFCILDHIVFSWRFLALVWPIICLTLLIIGTGMILSCFYVFFRDTQYLYNVFLTLLNYLSAVFYRVDQFPAELQRLFLLNPVYVIIKYIRTVVIDGHLPSLPYHCLCLFYPVLFVAIGMIMYRKYNHQFIYYF